jgi:hypothetical protein
MGRGAVREVTFTCDGGHRAQCWGYKGSDSRKQAASNPEGHRADQYRESRLVEGDMLDLSSQLRPGPWMTSKPEVNFSIADNRPETLQRSLQLIKHRGFIRAKPSAIPSY